MNDRPVQNLDTHWSHVLDLPDIDLDARFPQHNVGTPEKFVVRRAEDAANNAVEKICMNDSLEYFVVGRSF
jgi:hypothetical protein